MISAIQEWNDRVDPSEWARPVEPVIGYDEGREVVDGAGGKGVGVAEDEWRDTAAEDCWDEEEDEEEYERGEIWGDEEEEEDDGDGVGVGELEEEFMRVFRGF